MALKTVFTILSPASTTDTAIVRWSGTDGSELQDSNVLVDASGNVTTPADFLATGASSPKFQATDTTNSVVAILQANDTIGKIGTTSTHSLQIVTDNTAAITIDASQNATFSANIIGANVTTGVDPGHTHSIYTLPDGTRPFTGTVGGIDPVASTDLATKEYVDTAISFISTYYFNNTASGIGGIYFKMLEMPTGEGESTFTTAGLGAGDDQALTNFATDPNIPGVDTLKEGVYSGHLHAEKTAGTKPVELYFAIYTRASGGSETLRATSELSDEITSKTDVDLHASLLGDVDIDTTDRIIIKWFANVGITGSDATVALYAEGVNSSRLEVPTTTEVLSTIFVRQDGTTPLIGPWSMGNQALTNVNIDTGNIAGAVVNTNWDAAFTHVSSTGADHTYLNQSVTTTSNPTFNDITIDKATFKETVSLDAEVANTSTSNEATVDWRIGNRQKLTLSEDVTTLNFTDPAGIGGFFLRIIQDSTPRAITWPASVKWPDGAPPTLSAGSGAIDIVAFYYQSSNYDGVASQNFS